MKDKGHWTVLGGPRPFSSQALCVLENSFQPNKPMELESRVHPHQLQCTSCSGDKLRRTSNCLSFRIFGALSSGYHSTLSDRLTKPDGCQLSSFSTLLHPGLKIVSSQKRAGDWEGGAERAGGSADAETVTRGERTKGRVQTGLIRRGLAAEGRSLPRRDWGRQRC